MEKRSERRIYPRSTLLGLAEYNGKEGVRCQCVLDISRGGIRLEVSGPEWPGSQVELKLFVAGADGGFPLRGQVVWARHVAPFEVGIRFLDVPKDRADALEALLQAQQAAAEAEAAEDAAVDAQDDP